MKEKPVNKIYPKSLFSILMLVIAAGLIFYAAITGTLTFKTDKKNQESIEVAQIEHLLLTQKYDALDLRQVPDDLKPAPPHIQKKFKNTAIFHDPNIKNIFWIQSSSQEWQKLTLTTSPFFLFTFLAPKLILLFILISLSAYVLTRMIKKPLAQLTENLLSFKNNREIKPALTSGPKEIREVSQTVYQMMMEINEFDKHRQLVLAGVAHDICTPLARIRIAIEMLPHLDAQKKQALINDVEQINYLQEQFLSYTSTQEKQPLQAVDLAGLLESCAEQYPPQSIELNLPAQPLLVQANPRQLQRGIDNVLANAFQYGAAPVKILMQKENNEIMISITDSGSGVPEELLSKITQPLYRANVARSNSQGTGLGLAIFVEIIQALKGRVILTNTKPQGLQVKIYLPIQS
jgi:two-component system osmolarity sensor histidine kinase EnvZ